ncbi:MAG: HNH endonuclease signature motif containing protein, partial [Microbacterium gubbeenense]
HDVLGSIVQAAARSADAPSLGGSAPTLVVTTTISDLDGGIVDVDGVDVAAPAHLAHRIVCTGAVQKMVFDRNGRIVRIGTRERLFNTHQRRAIATRDGGCVIPGCSIPAGWCEIHHVDEHSRGGETHTDNGVLLCWNHHHNLERSGWAIRMRDGVPLVKAPGWVDRRQIYRPIRTKRTEREKVRRRTAAAPPPRSVTAPLL